MIELLGITSHTTIFFGQDNSLVFPINNPEFLDFNQSPFLVKYNSKENSDFPKS
ncbi:hypothetical protein CEPID_02385 [Corynebacterium epidermidicanis]|uniref:Uncharacterized protein n=1 Tax=Corynebacterium epidermidicanis TaxID=1050174 RepID=A0A0G3GS34_9CORY|nr:hypothetical protein CEPID_02385 [Corynebacterium epidermidicanis]